MAYANGKIYALRTHKGDDVYVGSTIRTLNERFNKHKEKRNKTKSKILLEKYTDVYIELIELFPCKNKKELEKREGEIQREYIERMVNKNIAGEIAENYNKNYRETNKEELKIKAQKYYEENKEELKIKAKTYAKEHTEEKQEYDKKYNKVNREKNKARNKAYYEANKERTLEQSRIKYAKAKNNLSPV